MRADVPWRRTTWYGGSNNAASNPPGRVLAVSPASAAFHHPAEVRRLADGTVEGRWMQLEQWQRFGPTSPIPAALLHELEEGDRKRADS